MRRTEQAGLRPPQRGTGWRLGRALWNIHGCGTCSFASAPAHTASVRSVSSLGDNGGSRGAGAACAVLKEPGEPREVSELLALTSSWGHKVLRCPTAAQSAASERGTRPQHHLLDDSFAVRPLVQRESRRIWGRPEPTGCCQTHLLRKQLHSLSEPPLQEAPNYCYRTEPGK